MKRLIGKVIREVLVNELDHRMQDIIFESIYSPTAKQIHCYSTVQENPYTSLWIESIIGAKHLIVQEITHVRYIDIKRSTPTQYGQYAWQLTSSKGTMEITINHATIDGYEPYRNLFRRMSTPSFTKCSYSDFIRCFPILEDLTNINKTPLATFKGHVCKCTRCPMHDDDQSISQKGLVNTRYERPRIYSDPWRINNVFYFEV